MKSGSGSGKKTFCLRPLGLHDLEFLNVQRLGILFANGKTHKKHTLIYMNYVLSLISFKCKSIVNHEPSQIFRSSKFNHETIRDPRNLSSVRPSPSVRKRPDSVSAFGQRSERWPDGVTIMSWMSCYNIYIYYINQPFTIWWSYIFM